MRHLDQKIANPLLLNIPASTLPVIMINEAEMALTLRT